MKTKIMKHFFPKPLSLILLLTISFTIYPSLTKSAKKQINKQNCTFHGIPLHGKVKVVEHFSDLKVKIKSSFADLKVKTVEHFANRCGEWQFVEHFPDFKIKFVQHFPDITIEFVSSFPGVR